jgi:hypothetical protein
MTAKPMNDKEALEAVGSAVAMAQYESRWTEELGAEHNAGLATIIRVIEAAREVVKKGRWGPQWAALAAALDGEP